MNVLSYGGLRTLYKNILAKINKKQDKLVDGENIKTINGESIVGKGDISVGGSDGVYVENLTVSASAKEGSVDAKVKAEGNNLDFTFQIPSADKWTIGEDGYWYINGEKTNTKAVGIADECSIGDDGYWYINGEKTDTKATGEADKWTIGEDGYWYINDEKTNHYALGTKGDKGDPGESADKWTIGDNGYWYVNGVETSYYALGTKGDPGESSLADKWTIGEDGYWYVNGEKTNTKAVGEDAEVSVADLSVDAIAETTAAATVSVSKSTKSLHFYFGLPKGDPGTEWEIGSDGYWYKDGVKTDLYALGTKGDKGDKGDPGESSTVPVFTRFVYIYKIQEEKPDTPTGGFWNTEAGTFTCPSGWSASYTLDDDDDIVWMSSAQFSSDTGKIVGEWSTPIPLQSKASSSAGVDTSGIEYIYYRTPTSLSGSAPSTPDNDEDTDSYVPTGWSDHPKGITSDLRCEWVCTRLKDDTTDKWGSWIGPVRWAVWGENGIDGDGVEYIYYRSTEFSAPSVPDVSSIIDTDEYQTREYVPDGWTDNPTGIDETNKYEWVCTRKYNHETSEWEAFQGSKESNYAKAALWAYWGGNDGDPGAYMKYCYILADSVDDIPEVEDWERKSTSIPSLWTGNIVYESGKTTFALQAMFNYDGTFVDPDTGWEGPYPVTGVKGDTGYAPNYKTYIYKYVQTKAQVMAGAAIIAVTAPTTTAILPSDEGWYDIPDTDDGNIWWQCIGTVNGVSSTVTEWGTPQRITMLDGEAQPSPYLEFRFAIGTYDSYPTINKTARDCGNSTKTDDSEKWLIELDTENINRKQQAVWMTHAMISADGSALTTDSEGNTTWATPVCISGEAGETGDAGYTTVVSIVFRRCSEDDIATPEGGDFTSPVPTTEGWSDGIPAEDGTGNPCWMSSRRFSDDEALQQNKWSAPVKCVDTSDFDICFSAQTDKPDEPTTHGAQDDSVWHSEGKEGDIWMATSTCTNGEWSDWSIVKIKGDAGDTGQSVLTSLVFKRNATQPDTPTGGSYSSPVPTGWSDGIPEADGNPCWVSSRVFTNDGKSPQQDGDDAWSEPQLAADTSSLDVCFSSRTSKPSDPSTDQDNIVQEDDTWHNVAQEDDVWMAERHNTNGTWGSWGIVKIKGEKGIGGNAIRLDLDNDNDSMLYDADGNLLSGSVTSQATLYNGASSILISSIGSDNISIVASGCTASIDKTTGIITVTGMDADVVSATVTVKFTYTYNDSTDTYTAVLSIKKLTDADAKKYDLILDCTSVKKVTVDDTTSYTPEAITIHVYKTTSADGRELLASLADENIGIQYSTNNSTVRRTLAYADGQASLRTLPTQSSALYQVTFYLMDKTDTTIVHDTETVAILQDGSDGSEGRGISGDPVDYWYAGTSSTTCPAQGDSEWQTSMPTLSADTPYLWTYEVINFTDGTSYVGKAHLVATYSEGIAYWLDCDPAVIAVDEDGGWKSSSFVATLYKSTNGEVSKPTENVTITAATASGTSLTTVTSGNPAEFKFGSLTPQETVVTAKVGTTQVSSYTLPVIKDGDTGTGTKGDSIEVRFMYGGEEGGDDEPTVYSSTARNPVMKKTTGASLSWVTNVGEAYNVGDTLTATGSQPDYRVLYFIQAYIDANDTLVGSWSEPLVWGQSYTKEEITGDPGQNGVSGTPGVSFEVRYIWAEEDAVAASNLTLVSNTERDPQCTTDHNVNAIEMTLTPDTAFNPLGTVGKTDVFGVLYWSQARIKTVVGSYDDDGNIKTSHEEVDGTWSAPQQWNGTNGSNGNNGRMIYPAGMYSETAEYTLTDTTAPYVYYQGEFYIYNDTTQTWVGTEQSTNPSNSSSWLKMDSFSAIFTKLLIAQGGLIGSLVFYGHYVFSQNGIDSYDEATSNYENFCDAYRDSQKDSDYYKGKVDAGTADPMDSDNDFRPNWCLNCLTGQVYENNAIIKGKITATSGTFTGTVNATSGTFTGTVNATGGTFIGNVTANSLTTKLTAVSTLTQDNIESNLAVRFCDSAGSAIAGFLANGSGCQMAIKNPDDGSWYLLNFSNLTSLTADQTDPYWTTVAYIKFSSSQNYKSINATVQTLLTDAISGSAMSLYQYHKGDTGNSTYNGKYFTVKTLSSSNLASELFITTYETSTEKVTYNSLTYTVTARTIIYVYYLSGVYKATLTFAQAYSASYVGGTGVYVGNIALEKSDGSLYTGTGITIPNSTTLYSLYSSPTSYGLTSVS